MDNIFVADRIIGGGLIGLLFTVLKSAPSDGCGAPPLAYIWLFQAIPLLMLLLDRPRNSGFLQDRCQPGWRRGVVNAIYRPTCPKYGGALESGLRATGRRSRPWPGVQLDIRSIVAPQALRIATPPTVGFMVWY